MFSGRPPGKKAGASAKSAAQGKGRNLGAQARVKKAQTKRFAKGAAEKLKTTKTGKYAEGGVGGVKSAAGMAARSAKSKVGKKTPGKALSTHVVQPGKGVGYRKLATSGTKVVRGQGDAAKKLAKIAVAGVGVQAAGNVAGAAGARALNKKSGTSKKRRR